MIKIRVLLGFMGLDKILAFKKMLMREPDIEIVGEATDTVDTLLKVGSTHADVVAIDLPLYGKDSGLCSHLLAEYPDVKIFAISEEGDEIVMYETVMMRRQASDTSTNKLADFIRRSVHGDDNGWDAMGRLPG